jgi:hypothetical protein
VPHIRTQALRTAIDTYRGELTAGQQWPWLGPHREAIRRHIIDAYTELATHTDLHTAATLLDHALQVDPYNENLRQQAIRACATAGHPEHIGPLLTTLTPPGPTSTHPDHWSHWRRRHQTRARHGHYQRQRAKHLTVRLPYQ